MEDQFAPEQNARRDLYCNLMFEIRMRTDLVQGILGGNYGLPKLAAYEMCHLQFRLICELIALGALAAHGDIPATQSGRLVKAYQADNILNGLEQLHSNFYPRPGKQVLDSNGKVKEVIPIVDGYLTKPNLLKLYRDCGELLHRGTMRTIRDRTTSDFEKIQHTVSEITTLLNHHQIELINSNYELWVVMRASKDDKVHASLMQKLTPEGSR
jgi:hypothetical protein